MIIVQRAYKSIDIQGIAIINTDNDESFLIQYYDFDLCMRAGRVVILTAVYPRYGPCDFELGPIMATYE